MRVLEAADQEFALVDHFFGEMVVEFDKEFFVTDYFAVPVFAIGVSRPRERPFTRSTIHLRTRILSLKPGHMKFPSASLRNQFTWKILGVTWSERCILI